MWTTNRIVKEWVTRVQKHGAPSLSSPGLTEEYAKNGAENYPQGKIRIQSSKYFNTLAIFAASSQHSTNYNIIISQK